MTDEQKPEIRVSYNRKLNRGDYNSADARITYVVPDNMDETEMRKKSQHLLALASIDVHRQLLKENDMSLEELADVERQAQEEHEEYLSELKKTLEEIKEQQGTEEDEE